MNMATKAQIRRILENALGLIANALDNALEKEQKIADRIEVAGNETEIVNMLMFYRKEDEDIND